MLDVRVSGDTDTDALVAFVERLAGAGRGGAAVRTAAGRVTADVRGGRIPAGLRTLSAALGSPAAPRPEEDPAHPATLLGVVAEEPFVVLSDSTPGELARALAELTGYGMRVLLTGAPAERVAAVHDALPVTVEGRVATSFPAMAVPELQRLRRLLARVGGDRDAGRGRRLPEAGTLPGPDDVAGCCERAARTVVGSETGEARVVPGLLRDLDADRRGAVTQVARCVLRSLEGLAQGADAERLRDVVGRLVHQGLRAEFEALQGHTARQRDDRARFAAGPRVEVLEPAEPGGDDVIRRYLDFLDAGGRTRSYFRPQEQKAADAHLRRFRVDGQGPQTHDHLAAVVNHLDLARRDDEIARLCAVLGLPIPRDAAELPALVATLDRVAATARSVGALRHDVLFLQQDSPVSVPDLAAAERVARAIVDYDEQGDPAEAADELERLAAACAGAVPDAERTPEHEAVVAALRAHDAAAYTAALEELDRARREVADHDELDRLLAELAATHPTLAETWAADAGRGVPGFGMVVTTPLDDVLAELPGSDTADLVVVLGAGAMQADGLLLTAAAPRMLAVVGDEPRAASSGTTLLEVLNQASARFLRGTGDRTAATPAPEPAVPAVPPLSSVPAARASAETPAPQATEVPAPRPAPRPAPEPRGDEPFRPSAPSAMAPGPRPAVTGGRED
ncbi:hypothetical protein [Pseudonocardia spirodelae]|uniref:Uncharacterized protein n=1 Tax=Pseudonocardia spirodelae TaxID=3133431 RepID=A0ABU8TCW7_9PSEU